LTYSFGFSGEAFAGRSYSSPPESGCKAGVRFLSLGKMRGSVGNLVRGHGVDEVGGRVGVPDLDADLPGRRVERPYRPRASGPLEEPSCGAGAFLVSGGGGARPPGFDPPPQAGGGYSEDHGGPVEVAAVLLHDGQDAVFFPFRQGRLGHGRGAEGGVAHHGQEGALGKPRRTGACSFDHAYI